MSRWDCEKGAYATNNQISKSLIEGRVFAIVRPWYRWRWISNRDWAGSERVKKGKGVRESVEDGEGDGVVDVVG